MDNTLTITIADACAKAGLDESTCRRVTSELQAAVAEKVRTLSSENQQLRAEVERYEKVQQEVAMLLKAKNPSHIVHDLRNVLNELALLKAVVGEE